MAGFSRLQKVHARDRPDFQADAMNETKGTADGLFERYAAALLARDAAAIASMYAVPSLILFASPSASSS